MSVLGGQGQTNAGMSDFNRETKVLAVTIYERYEHCLWGAASLRQWPHPGLPPLCVLRKYWAERFREDC